MKRFALLALLPLLLGGADPKASFRFERPIQTGSGWSVLELPDDVLDACRAGLPDLRILDAQGVEIPFAFDRGEITTSHHFPVRDVETVPASHTLALVDRGAEPGWADRADLELVGSNFLKPVIIEASSDRNTWSQIARGSVFRTGAVSSTSMRFPINDRRWWRVRLDDRNGAPVQLTGVVAWQSPSATTLREIPIELRPERTGDADATTFTVTLPAANLAVSAIRIDASDPAFLRKVRVYERVFLRDEVDRVLLGEGTIYRASEVEDTVRLRPPSSRVLEVEIDKAGGLELRVTRLRAVVEQQRLLFHADGKQPVSLVFGSASAERPRYDLEAAFAHGRPQAPSQATAGPTRVLGTPQPALANPTRGGVLDPEGWQRHQDVILPTSGSIAYLDLDLPPSDLASVRIVDQRNQQVPYVIESAPRARTTPVQLQVRASGGKTIVHIEGFKRWQSVRAIEIGANAPAYFERQVFVKEVQSDARGVAGTREIGNALWKKAPNEAFTPVRIAVDSPKSDVVEVEIDNGDNAPVSVTSASVAWEVRRLDFVYEPGDKLVLLSDNRAAAAPRYDLALVAGRVLSSPAEVAKLGPPRVRDDTHDAVPRWFWGFVVAAGILVVLALARTLRGGPEPPAACGRP